MRRLRIVLKPLFLFFCLALISCLELFSPRHGLAEIPSSSSQVPFSASLISNRPKMVFIDALGIFYAPDSRYNFFLIDLTWYYYYDGKWYKSRSPEGSWRYISYCKLPDVLKTLPERYIKKRDSLLQADAKPPKEKKGKAVKPKEKMKSSLKKSPA